MTPVPAAAVRNINIAAERMHKQQYSSIDAGASTLLRKECIGSNIGD